VNHKEIIAVYYKLILFYNNFGEHIGIISQKGVERNPLSGISSKGVLKGFDRIVYNDRLFEKTL